MWYTHVVLHDWQCTRSQPLPHAWLLLNSISLWKNTSIFASLQIMFPQCSAIGNYNSRQPNHFDNIVHQNLMSTVLVHFMWTGMTLICAEWDYTTPSTWWRSHIMTDCFRMLMIEPPETLNNTRLIHISHCPCFAGPTTNCCQLQFIYFVLHNGALDHSDSLLHKPIFHYGCCDVELF